MTGHIPVLLDEMLSALNIQDEGVYLDATFGGGGYTQAILSRAHCQVIALDRDPDAIHRAEFLQAKYPDRLQFFAGTFADLPNLALEHHFPRLDGIVFDFGISSFQIDEPERGFSFRFDGPLDMRMSKEGISAADVVNTFPENELANIIYQFGQERKSRRIAHAIAIQRKIKPFETTLELANLVKSAIGGRPDQQHPATLTFQALRIFVNNELIEIEKGLSFAEEYLKQGGRLVTVTFHSLEDHLVKTFLRQRSKRTKVQSRLLPGESQPPTPTFLDLFPKGVSPSRQEIQENPRCRSARLRVAEYLGSDHGSTESKNNGDRHAS